MLLYVAENTIKHRYSSLESIEYESTTYELLNDIDIMQRINIQRLRWLGHVGRMQEDASTRRVFDAGIYGSWRKGRPCICWKDQIVINWRRSESSRVGWKDVLWHAGIR